jgi:hypothetical protein
MIFKMIFKKQYNLCVLYKNKGVDILWQEGRKQK